MSSEFRTSLMLESVLLFCEKRQEEESQMINERDDRIRELEKRLAAFQAPVNDVSVGIDQLMTECNERFSRIEKALVEISTSRI